MQTIIRAWYVCDLFQRQVTLMNHFKTMYCNVKLVVDNKLTELNTRKTCHGRNTLSMKIL